MNLYPQPIFTSLLVTAVGLVPITACSSSVGTGEDAGADTSPDTAPVVQDAGPESEAGDSSVSSATDSAADRQAQESAAPDSEAGLAEAGLAEGGALGFAPGNVPAATSLVAPGDWVFSSQTCAGRTNVQIDTSKGTSDCDGQTKPYSYTVITQNDMSLGPLQAALFVTNKLTIQTGMTVTVVGNLPLIVVALSDVTISGLFSATVDTIYADQAYAGGASGPAQSTNGNGPGGGTTPATNSGAGGGGFCGTGGDGAASGDAGVAGGKAYGNATNVPLLGGSSGGSGSYEKGGGGGGAVQIDSATSIQITAVGVVNVGGGGGGWSRSGGGSGGALLLEAPSVSINGTLAANGGGGAESGNNNSGQNAQASASPAAGGAADFSSANAQLTNAGGAGAAGTAVNGAASPLMVSSTSAGGGGGGSGRIRINTASGAATIGQTAVVSPSLSTMCSTQGTLTH